MARIGVHEVLLDFFCGEKNYMNVDRAKDAAVLTYPTFSKLYTMPASASFRFRAACLRIKRFSAVRCCISVRD
jgi:hypothetical protein